LDEVAHMREAFDIRRKAISSALNAIPGVSCPVPQGAFYAFPNVEALLNKPLGPQGSVATSSAELAALLLTEAHIAAVPGEAFGAPGYLRFSYALADEDLAKGMQRMHDWVLAQQ
jgi:aspartate/methionine/tyrosine aminotransferase